MALITLAHFEYPSIEMFRMGAMAFLGLGAHSMLRQCRWDGRSPSDVNRQRLPKLPRRAAIRRLPEYSDARSARKE